MSRLWVVGPGSLSSSKKCPSLPCSWIAPGRAHSELKEERHNLHFTPDKGKQSESMSSPSSSSSVAPKKVPKPNETEAATFYEKLINSDVNCEVITHIPGYSQRFVPTSIPKLCERVAGTGEWTTENKFQGIFKEINFS